MTEPWWALVCLSVLVPGLAACSSPTAKTDEVGPSLEVPQTPEPGIRGKVSALRALGAGPEYATDKFVEACMHKAGWTYVPLTQEAFVSAALPGRYEDERAVVTPEGYVATPEPAMDEASVENSGRAGLSQEENRRFEKSLNGDLDTYVNVADPVAGGTVGMAGQGCRAQAVDQVFGSVGDYLVASSLRGNLHLRAFQAARGSKDMQNLNRAWQKCMEDSDLPATIAQSAKKLSSGELSTPEDAVTLALGGTDIERLGAREQVQLARADVRCQDETSYVQERTSIEDRYLTAYTTYFAGQVTATQELYSAAQARASDALG